MKKDMTQLIQEEIFLNNLEKHSHPFVAQWARLHINNGATCSEIRNTLARLVQKSGKELINTHG